MKKILIAVFSVVLSLSITVSCLAAGVYYLPDVTSEMSSPSYWAEESDILMSYDEIENLNRETIQTKGTNMYDLKNQPEVVDGISLNEAIKKSSQADAAYYLGWTYLENTEKATQEDYDKIIENTQNPDAKKEQKVLYGIATKRTELRTFPAPVAIWDDPADSDFDYQYLVSVRVNEPVVITSKSKDGNYYLAKSICCSGWIPKDAVAICDDKDEWISAWDIKNENVLVVWGDKVFTETSIVGAETSDLMLTMGTVLELAKDVNPNELIDNRAAYNNYAVWVPVRNDDGTYSKKLTLISEHKKVYEGYMPLTKENISKVVFSALGNTYGWGGSLNSDDCSGYMRNVYKCFGMELARNTTWQSSMPMAKVNMQYMAKEEKIKFFDALPFGTILYFSGHEMMYLGERNEKYYVISAVGTIMQPENPSVRQRIRSTIVNTLDVKRANGNTWFDELTVALVPYFSVNENTLPEYEWYHDGVAYCLKNKIMQGDENKFFNPSKNITWAELLQILYNMEETKPEYEFEEDAAWYAGAVKWAKDSELIYENDKDFESESVISRQQLASVLYLYAQFKGYDVSVGEETNILSYDDAFDISEYAIPAMQYVIGAGIINGKTSSTVNPEDNATRAEIAVILERFVQYNIRMEEVKKNTVDYTKDFTDYMYQPKSDDSVIDNLKTIDRCSYGTAGSSLSQVVAGVSVLKLSKADGVNDKLSEYLKGMDATQKDYFSFQWQMCMKRAYGIIENPESFEGALRDAGLDNIDMSDFDKDGLDELNSTIMSELEKSNIKNEWKNHFEIEPFTFWED